MFRDSDYDIKTLLRTVVKSAVFQNKQNYAALIKSPLELTLGLMRERAISVESYTYINKVNTQLGQALFHPPAGGWRGGTNWLDNKRLTRRHDVISKLLAEHSETSPDTQPSYATDLVALKEPHYQLR